MIVFAIAFVPRALAALGACFVGSGALAQGAELRYLSQIQLDQPTEILAYDDRSGRILATLVDTPSVAIIDIDDPSSPSLVRTVDFSDLGATVNSVAARDGVLAAAISADPVTDAGWAVVFDIEGKRIAEIRVGALPDMICFTPDGKHLLTANEGEPNEDGSIDPPGSVSIIDLSSYEATVVDLSAISDRLAVNWLSRPELTPASHIEPEYIAVTTDSRTAYVVCQENNAVAEIDLVSAQLVGWHWLGVVARGAFDALRQPDGIVAFETRSGLRIVTANEGDPRKVWGEDGIGEYEGVEVAALSLEDRARPVRFGTGGISVFDEEFVVLADTGPDIVERLEEGLLNGSISEHTMGRIARRDGKRGVEPEGLAHYGDGEVEHIFVGLERAGMIAHYTLDTGDVLTLVGLASIPTPEVGGHLASPEGLQVVPPDQSGHGVPIVLVTDERYGTLTIFELRSE